jgi:hypothetical protein
MTNPLGLEGSSNTLLFYDPVIWWNDAEIVTFSAACCCNMPTILNRICCTHVEIPPSDDEVIGIAPDCLYLD